VRAPPSREGEEKESELGKKREENPV